MCIAYVIVNCQFSIINSQFSIINSQFSIINYLYIPCNLSKSALAVR